MKKLEIAAILSVIIGMAFRIMHWPWANIILIISIQILCILDLAALRLLAENVGLSEWFKNKNTLKKDKRKTMIFRGAGVALTLIWTALLINIMIWPGSTPMLTYGLIAGVVSLSFTLLKVSSGDKSYFRVAIRLIPMLLLAVLFYIKPNVWIDYHYNYDHKSRNLLREMRSNPNDTAVINQFRKRMDFYLDSCNNASPLEVIH
ncbi:hypothetical protein N8368_02270 [Bacteroidia bacterium]|nr:hypothetical protein [Bacteroidia bacterium]MDB9882533.1 hypothetical protein [Bacteroidia bacterium]MDC1395313.1 hypothetical protein [Bacteroidia bacterium]